MKVGLPAVVGVVIWCRMFASRSCDVVGAGGSIGVRSKGESASGTRVADIAGSSVTSVSNAEVDAVAASGRAVAASGGVFAQRS